LTDSSRIDGHGSTLQANGSPFKKKTKNRVVGSKAAAVHVDLYISSHSNIYCALYVFIVIVFKNIYVGMGANAHISHYKPHNAYQVNEHNSTAMFSLKKHLSPGGIRTRILCS
jgi:hypothetical protein